MITQFFGYSITSIAALFLKAWIHGDKQTKFLFYIFFISSLSGSSLMVFVESKSTENPIYKLLAWVLLSIAFVSFAVIISLQAIRDEAEVEKEIKQKEADLKANPENSQTAWDLARIKLESYLNRNIIQIRWIFIWTMIVMLAAFTMIGYGVVKVYADPVNFQASIMVTVAGLITEFIAVTFLIIYKSTVNQAKDYVNVLERINAVGMSIQILETLSKDSEKLKDNSKAELAKELLQLYGKTQKN